ncbi:DUF1572 family protein [Pleomorphovibrio marinus]|uniref:DUF1572 family protein n=1 Tax=Pleomorphovibrio marinus TaxID=2164132 RepID=UPI001E4E3ADA|nr:DUF1572 family protein [Pleomorphovibrio marinus]
MDPNIMHREFLESTLGILKEYKQLGEKALQQIPKDKWDWQYNDNSNSVSVLVKHLWGNMMSRWTDFLNSDGEKPWRQRDAEFEAENISPKELMEKWEEGWMTLFEAISDLTIADMEKEVLINGKNHSVYDALLRQLAHYASHIGQILYIGKMLKDQSWINLSVPKRPSTN